jgi:hypothetical protein
MLVADVEPETQKKPALQLPVHVLADKPKLPPNVPMGQDVAEVALLKQ